MTLRKTTIRTTTTQHQVSNIDTKGESLVNLIVRATLHGFAQRRT